MQKRAELTSSQIATLILTIAGFLVALIFLLIFLDTDSLSDREICKLSVLTRATAPEALQRLAPLKCTTQKICLSESGSGKCKDNQFIGEKEDKIIPIKVSSKEDLEKTVADSMYDCWSMMGEGKLDVFGGDTGVWSLLGAGNLKEKKTICLICSRLAIAAELENSPRIKLDEVNVNSYMETHQVPNSQKTYLQTFTDDQIRSYPQQFRDTLGKNDGKAQSTNEIAILFMQINTQEDPGEAAFGTGIKTGAFLLTAGASVGGLGYAPVATGALATIGGGATASIAYYQTWKSQSVAAARCGQLTSISEARKGCSVVIPISYKNIAAINNDCSLIEGQP